MRKSWSYTAVCTAICLRHTNARPKANSVWRCHPSSFQLVTCLTSMARKSNVACCSKTKALCPLLLRSQVYRRFKPEVNFRFCFPERSPPQPPARPGGQSTYYYVVGECVFKQQVFVCVQVCMRSGTINSPPSNEISRRCGEPEAWVQLSLSTQQYFIWKIGRQLLDDISLFVTPGTYSSIAVSHSKYEVLYHIIHS